MTEANLQELGRVDILMMPIDAKHHILKDAEIQSIRKALRPRILIPMHYGFLTSSLLATLRRTSAKSARGLPARIMSFSWRAILRPSPRIAMGGVGHVRVAAVFTSPLAARNSHRDDEITVRRTRENEGE